MDVFLSICLGGDSASQLTESQEAHEAQNHHPVQDVFGIADGRHRPAGSPVGGVLVLLSQDGLSVLEVRHVPQFWLGGEGKLDGGVGSINNNRGKKRRSRDPASLSRGASKLMCLLPRRRCFSYREYAKMLVLYFKFKTPAIRRGTERLK